MSEPAQGAAAPTPAPAAPEAAPKSPPATPTAAPSAPEPPKAPHAESITLSSDALKQRLDRAKETARADILKEFGVDTPDAIRTALDAAREREEAQKTLEQRLADEKAAREADRSRLASYEQTVKARAELELESLDEAQRAAVNALAGDDPAARLRAIDTLKPTWAKGAAAPATPAAPAKPPPAPSSLPPRDAPSQQHSSPPDRKAQYEELRGRNPMAASLYLAAHSREILGR